MNKKQQSTSHINDIWDELLNSEASRRFLEEQVKKAEELLHKKTANSLLDLDS